MATTYGPYVPHHSQSQAKPWNPCHIYIDCAQVSLHPKTIIRSMWRTLLCVPPTRFKAGFITNPLILDSFESDTAAHRHAVVELGDHRVEPFPRALTWFTRMNLRPFVAGAADCCASSLVSRG